MTEGGHHTIELLWKGFNILLLLGIAYFFARRPLSEAFGKYFIGITERLNHSEMELESARQDLKRAKFEYEDAQRRYKEQIKLAEETAGYIKEEEIKRAQDIADRIREKAKEVIEIETKKAKEELVRYGMRKAKEVSARILEEAFKDPQIQRRYIEKSIREMEEACKRM
ncbi:MAG: hypothetical protein ACK4SM_00290 [Aquificaceae bacterium]